MQHEVIMPALGMAQVTGHIVSWTKAPGDAVRKGDTLFEVETDKSTVEVEAMADGFLADVRAPAGSDVPVGDVIALITATKPIGPVVSSIREPDTAPVGAPVPAPVGAPAPAPAETKAKANTLAAVPAKAAAPAKTVPAAGGRILASPKARRLALEQGLDLSRLVEAGQPQPYHVCDIETLRNLPKAPEATSGASASHVITAEVSSAAVTEFVAWLEKETRQPVEETSLLAAYAASALRGATGLQTATVAVERFGVTRITTDPDAEGLGQASRPTEDIANIWVRDMRGSRITSIQSNDTTGPILTLFGGEVITITLTCPAHLLGSQAAIALISAFADRLADPLRQIL